jgi:hypothetical protein
MALRTIRPQTSVGKLALLLALAGGSLLPSVGAQEADVGQVVDLVLRKVVVQQTKVNGDSWDPLGGKPDLRVTIATGAKRYRSPLKTDVYSHDFKAKTLRVRAGDVVEIAVHDQDAVADDEIGRVRVAITAGQMASGTAVFKSFGRVKELHVEFKP